MGYLRCSTLVSRGGLALFVGQNERTVPGFRSPYELKKKKVKRILRLVLQFGQEGNASILDASQN